MNSHDQHDPPKDNTHTEQNSRMKKPDKAIASNHEIAQEEEDVYFLIPRIVTFVYGPYSYEGIMDYRTERLKGLKTRMEKQGVTVVMKPCLDNVDLVQVWFLDHLIFSCRITQLAHGGDGERDKHCSEAVDALENYLKVVVQRLRETKHPDPTELKRPFCPCFHVGENNQTGGGCGCCEACDAMKQNMG